MNNDSVNLESNLEPIEVPSDNLMMGDNSKHILDSAYMNMMNNNTNLLSAISEKEVMSQNVNTKEELFKPEVDSFIQNKNTGIDNTINDINFKSEEEAYNALKFANENKDVISDNYTDEQINKVKLDTLKLGNMYGVKPVNEIEELFSKAKTLSDSKFLANETLNDLSEKDGITNTLTSFGSTVLGYKPVFESLFDDNNLKVVNKEISDFQKITDPELKNSEAIRLTKLWYERTNKNSFTTSFLIAQMNNPWHEKNLTTDVVLDSILLLTGLGVAEKGLNILKTPKKIKAVKELKELQPTLAKKVKNVATKKLDENKVDDVVDEIVDITKEDIKASTKKPVDVDVDVNLEKELTTSSRNLDDRLDDFKTAFNMSDKSVGELKELIIRTQKNLKSKPKNNIEQHNKAVLKTVKEVRDTFNSDLPHRMEQVGNHSGAAEFVGSIVDAAKENPIYLKQLSNFTGIDEDTIVSMSKISDVDDLEIVIKNNPKAFGDIKTVNVLQENFRNYYDLRNTVSLDSIIDTKAAIPTATPLEIDNYVSKLQSQFDAKQINDITNMNAGLKVDVKYDSDIDKVVANQFKNDKLVSSVEYDLEKNIVDPFTLIKGSKFDVRNLQSKTSEFLISPQNLLNYGVKYDDNLIGTLSIVDELTILKNQGSEFLREAEKQLSNLSSDLKKLSKSEYKKVNDALIEGDLYRVGGVNISKEFTKNELINKGFNAKEINSYFQVRFMVDELYKINNKKIRDEMVMKGYRSFSIDITPKIEQQLNNSTRTKYNIVNNKLNQFGIKIDSKDVLSVKQNYSKQHVFFEDTQQVVRFGELNNDEILGYNVVRLTDNIGIENKSVRFILTNKEPHILPERVLHYRKGMMPRNYKSRFFIYKVNKYGAQEVVMAVDRKSQLKKALKEVKTKYPNDIIEYKTEGQDILISEADSFSKYNVNLESNLSFSTNIRKVDLLLNQDGVVAPMVNPLETLSKQVQAASATVNMSKYKVALIERLDKTVMNAITKIDPKTGTKVIVKNILNDNTNVLNGIKKEFLNDYYDLQKQINYVNKNIIDPVDPLFENYSNTVRNLVNIIDEKTTKLIPEKFEKLYSKLFDNKVIGLNDIENHNPVEIIKTINFIRLLGLFNPRQAILQPMQATAILSVSPKHGSKAIGDYIFSQLKKGNFRKNPKTLNNIMSKNYKDLDYLDNAILDIKDSNILSSIRNNDDLYLQSNGILSTSKLRLKKTIDAGMYFYDKGNEFIYSTAYFTARRELLGDANRRLSKSEQISVIKRTNQLAFNYTTANKAGFQSGVSSLGTQFLQVPAKAYESLLSNQFTFGEKMRLLAGQGLFFGYAGVPIGQAVSGYLMNLFGITEEEVKDKYSEHIYSIQNGLVGTAFSDILNYKVDVENLTLFGGGVRDIPFYDFFVAANKENDLIGSSKILKEFLGPTYDTTSGMYNILNGTVDMISNFVIDDVDKGYANAKKTFFSNDSDIVKFVSTANNLSKAITIMETGRESNSYGQTINIYDEDQRSGRAIGSILGLKDIETAKTYIKKYQLDVLKDRELTIKNRAKELYLDAIKNGSFKAQQNILYSECSQMNFNDRYCTEVWSLVSELAINDLESTKSEGYKQKIKDALLNVQDVDKALTTEYKINK